MGNLILTRSPRAAHPYYVPELGIRLYTAEELSYHIYNNLMLIDRGFIDERLLTFLRECGQNELAAKLERWKDDADFWELLLVILQDVHFYNGQELEKFRAEAARIATEGHEKIMHEKADYMLSIGRYYDSIRMYEKLLESRSDYALGKKVRSGLFEGLGVAHARLFIYDKAAEAYAMAYAQNKNEKYLRSIYMIHLISPETPYPSELFGALEPGRLSAWAAEYEAAREQAALYGKARAAAELSGKDDRRRRAGYLDLISEWKTEYRRCMS